MDNGQWTNNGLFNDYTWQGLASKLRVHTAHENSTVSRRRVTSCYYFTCKTQKYVLLLYTLKPKAKSCEPPRLRSYQWVNHHDCVHIDDLASLHNCIHTENQQSYDSVSRYAIPGKQRSRGSASRNYIRQMYGNIHSDDSYVTLRTNEEYPWQGSVSVHERFNK